MTPGNSQAVIRQAENRDVHRVINYIDHAPLIHRNLDWRPLIEWVEKPPFLLRMVNDTITAILSCAPDPPGVAWIHCYATNSFEGKLEETWSEMLHAAVQYIKAANSSLYAIAMHDWFTDLLLHSGFQRLQSIVSLTWHGVIPPQLPLSSRVLIRPMEFTDLDQVAMVDGEAFSKQWVISSESLKRVYYQAEHTSVAEVEGQIVAYEISTADHFAFHLTRLAVLPAHARANIGYSLVRDVFDYFSNRGIHQGTVNTQDDNHASLSLYQKLGYGLTHDNFPVYRYGY